MILLCYYDLKTNLLALLVEIRDYAYSECSVLSYSAVPVIWVSDSDDTFAEKISTEFLLKIA